MTSLVLGVLPAGAAIAGQPETARFQGEIDRAATAGGGRVTVTRGVHPCGF